MATIKIKVGASADRSIDAVFSQAEKRAIKARDNIAKAFGKPIAADMLFKARGAGGGGAYKQIGADGEQAMNKLARASAKAHTAMVRDQQRATREMMRGFKEIGKVAEKEQMSMWRAERRARDAFAARTSHRATRFLFPAPTGMLSAAGRVGGDILRGAGVDFSLSGSVSRAVSLQSATLGLANQERIATGKTRGAGFYENMARTTGDKFSQSPEAIIGMIRSFTGKTGNFAAAGSMSNELASIGVSSGANLEEMGDAAGYVYNQLKNLPGAGEKTIAVMRGIVGQTAVGAVEMKDYATQMGRVAANAQKFEGDTANNILKLSAMTQLNIEAGGATSAADAARGTAAFVNTLGKGARMSAFKKAGVSIFADKEQTIHRDPFEILKDSFRATGGNIPQLADMYADVLGRKTITGLSGSYKAAGGGEAGITAISAQLQKYMNAQLSKETEKQNLADIEQSAAAKAQRFQNNLDKVAASMADKVLPELEKLAPVALQVAEGFAGLIGFLTRNPGIAIVGAITASIARAGLESAFRTAIDRFMGGKGGVGGGSVGVGGGGRFGYTGTGFSKGSGASFGGSVAAVGMGAAIGIPLAAGIYASGTTEFGANTKDIDAISKGLSGKYGNIGSDIVGAKSALQAKKDEYYGGMTGGIWGHFKDAVGIGNEAEFKGAEDLIKRKEREYAQYQRTGALPPGVTAAQAAASQQQKLELDPTQISRGVADGLSARTLNMRLTNPGDIKLNAGATGGKLNGRDASP